MALISMIGQLERAQADGYAIPCFDTFDQLGVEGIINALEAKRAPGIIGLPDRLMEDLHGRAFTQLLRTCAEDATGPVSIVLDHGVSLEHCVRALRFGCSDVMLDASKLPFEENVAATRLVVRAAHAVGAGVEAELGHVGSGQDYDAFGAQGKGLTDPAMVEAFVAQTGVDALAVAIGTAHGVYKGEPKLALDLLSEIRSRVDIPLVLHGGSGLSDAQFRATIERGISKINVFTNLALEAAARVTRNVHGGDASYHSIIAQIREGFQAQCELFLDVFGATGRA